MVSPLNPEFNPLTSDAQTSGWQERLRDLARRIDTLGAPQVRIRETLLWLIRLRSVAFIGQTIAVFIGNFSLHLDLPWKWLLPIICVTPLTNLLLLQQEKQSAPLRFGLLIEVLFLDTALLTALLAFSGGAHNPFISFYLVHVVIAAVALGSVAAWIMAGIATVASLGLFVLSQQYLHLAISAEQHLQGMLWATGLTACCIAYFASRLSHALNQSEKALGQMQLLKEQNERFASLTTLAAGVAHELGSPLGTIAVIAQELGRTPPQSLPADTRSDIELLSKEVLRCRTIIDRLSRRSSAEFEEASSIFFAHLLFGEIQCNLPAHYRTRIILTVPQNLELHLPRPALEQAIRYLLNNAFEASAETSSVWLTLETNENQLVLSVRDEGTGLSVAASHHAGEPFFTTKEPGAGMGLGLFLVRLLAERLNGEFTLSTPAHGGTLARLQLPTHFSV